MPAEADGENAAKPLLMPVCSVFSAPTANYFFFGVRISEVAPSPSRVASPAQRATKIVFSLMLQEVVKVPPSEIVAVCETHFGLFVRRGLTCARALKLVREKLRDRDSNPDFSVQSRASYH